MDDTGPGGRPRRSGLRGVLDWAEGLPDNHLLARLLTSARIQKHQLEWRARGKSVPLPSWAKQSIIRLYGQRYGTRILVETGTYRGDTTSALKSCFDHVYSIELDPDLYRRAAARFAAVPEVTILHGDSAALLPSLLRGISQSCLFWLDAHWSGGITARGPTDTPVAEELEAILAHPVNGHVILIDDIRCFTGRDGYPRLEDIEGMVRSRRPGHVVRVEADIARIHPDPRRPPASH